MRRAMLLSLLVASVAAPVAHAAFPGENGKLVFTSRVESPDPEFTGPPQVFTVNPDGSNLTRLTFSGIDEDPGDFSPDGSRIAFARLSEPPSFDDVWVMNADGTGEVRLPGIPDAADYPSDWSPDGSRIFFGGDGGSWSMLASDGSDKILHANSGAAESGGVPSPDGERIAFLSSFDTFAGRTFDIWTVNLNGMEDWVRLTINPFEESSPDYSPDGSRIAFTSDRDGDWDVYTMNVDGSAVAQLTNNSGAHEFAVAWSPDGTRLAFTSTREGANSSKLFVMNTDGSGQTKVSDIEVDSGLDWQPVQNRPPECDQVRATPSSLGAPNRRFVTVTLSGATDPDGDAVDLEITGVTQDEPVGPRDAISSTQPNRVRLRAERDPHGDGRVYRIAFEVSDGRGGTCTGYATAGVRKGSQAPVDSAPPSYDSFGS
jgi:Tol biopolymer transport system component